MRNSSDESPSSRGRHHHQYKSKVSDMNDDNTEEERYKQDDLRTKLNELKKSKDHHRDRATSSSDRDQHNKHRNSRQLQVHDYDSSYTKSSSSTKRDTYTSSRETTRDSNYSSYQQAKHHGHHYQQAEAKSYKESSDLVSSSSSSGRHSSEKRSSKSSVSSSNHLENVKYTDQSHHDVNKKSEKYERTKITIEAEVNEIFSEEEKSSSESDDGDSAKSSSRLKSEAKLKSTSQERKSPETEQRKTESNKMDLNSENLRAEIDLRNKLKRKIQAESNSQTEENDDNESDQLKTTAKETSRSIKDPKRNRKEHVDAKKRNSRSSASSASNNSGVGQDSNESTHSESDHSVDTDREDRDQTPDNRSDRSSQSRDNSDRDELDEKMEEYYKKTASKKSSHHKQDDHNQMDTEPKEAPLSEEKPNENIILPPPPPEILTYYCATQGSRSVEEFECLNKIEEGAYGVVFRAKDKKSNEVVALKRLKMEKEKEGFPITSIREIDTLLKAQHPNVVTVREIVVGSNMDKIYMVMDYVEHDLKSLMQYSMKKPFMMAEVKTLMIQLLRGVAHLHDNWIIHRDLKTSNLLLSHKGVLKIADFGLAREYGSPLKEYTAVVVTLWYRSPELLLATKKYSTGVDIWSVGCIFGELMLMKALFPGKNEKDQLDKIFKDLGTPNDKIWPNFKDLPLTKKLNFPEFPYNTLRSRFGNYLSDKGFELINKLLTYDPDRRISAEDALKHEFFKETPLPIDPTMFPTWPAKSEGLTKNKLPQDSEPRAPSPGKMYEKLLGNEEDGFVLQFPPISTGFTLR